MTEPNAGGDAQTVEQLQAELEKTQAALKAANAESAERRHKLKEFEDKQSANLTEQEKLTARLADLEKKNADMEAQETRRKISDAIEEKARELGFEHPQDAQALIDTAAVEIDDAGNVKGFEQELKKLAESGRLPMKGDKPTRQPGSLRPAFTNHQITGGNPDDKTPAPSPNLTHF